MLNFLLLFILLVLLWKFTVIVLALAVIIAAIVMLAVLIATIRSRAPASTEIISSGNTMEDTRSIIRFIDGYADYIHTGRGNMKRVRGWDEDKYLLYVLVRTAHEQGLRVRVKVAKKNSND